VACGFAPMNMTLDIYRGTASPVSRFDTEIVHDARDKTICLTTARDQRKSYLIRRSGYRDVSDCSPTACQTALDAAKC